MADMDPHHASGHRKRLRDRFLKGGVDGLADYELLELLLMAAIPRRDVKPLAKDLIRDFGSYAAVLAAKPARLEAVPGLGPSAIALLKTVEASAQIMAREPLDGRSVLTSWDALTSYLKTAMSHLSDEQFRVLYLGGSGMVLDDQVVGQGDAGALQVSSRVIVARALALDARAVILAHNHPSGAAKPSQSDIEATREIAAACAPLGIELHDHIIVAAGKCCSFKSLGLL